MKMELPAEISEEAVKDEIAFLKGSSTPTALYNKASTAKEAADQIKGFTESYPDPFAPGFNFINPWATKKENKNKKDRDPSKIRPKMSSDVSL